MIPHQKLRGVRALLVVGLLGLATTGARVIANTYTYNYDQVYSGATPPGTAPWLSATFQDPTLTGPNDPNQGKVYLTLRALNLAKGEFVSEWWFNLNDNSLLSGLSYSVVGQSGAFKLPTVAIPADTSSGPLRFDVSFDFSTKAGSPTGPGGSDSKRFDGSDNLTLLLANTGHNLAAADFLSPSVSKGGLMADTSVFIQGLPGGKSSHVGDGPPSLPDRTAGIQLTLLGILLLFESQRRFQHP